jgi:ABC-type sugar transport system ATPase subunit
VPKISFRNVKKVYPSGTYALNNINFDIEQGDFVSIIGESGGGKTTLLKLISGLEKATSGEIYFDDEISNFIKVAQRDVAFVFQDYTIYPNMTVFENILMALNKHKISYEAKCEIAWDIIKKMNLEMIHGEVPNSLSFGQCQKVALAKTLVRKPKIVLFDEPLSNIDASAKQEYKKLILNAKEVLPDSTFIYVTHSINDALQLSNKIMVIHNGEILQFDEKQMVFEFPNSTLVADYILEGNQKYRGQIINGFFISDKKEIKLDEFQLSSLHQQNLDNVICYSLGNINVFFDETGQSLTCFKKILKIDLVIIDNRLSTYENCNFFVSNARL